MISPTGVLKGQNYSKTFWDTYNISQTLKNGFREQREYCLSGYICHIYYFKLKDILDLLALIFNVNKLSGSDILYHLLL